jgi:hypothetical protein
LTFKFSIICPWLDDVIEPVEVRAMFGKVPVQDASGKAG